MSSVSPVSGPASGGTNITIMGTGFTAGSADTKVVIGQGHGAGTGAIAATNVVVVSPTEITATTGAGALAGHWGVFVTANGATSTHSPTATFRYLVTVSSVSAALGPISGGTAITITGSGFAPGATVLNGQSNGARAGAIAATSVVVVSPTEITAATGARTLPGLWGYSSGATASPTPTRPSPSTTGEPFGQLTSSGRCPRSARGSEHRRPEGDTATGGPCFMAEHVLQVTHDICRGARTSTAGQ